MKRNLIIASLFTGLFFVACEEDVVLDLGEIQHRLVVEAVVSNSDPLVKVTLSYSQGFYDTLSFVPFKDALVEIQSGSGETEELILSPEGYYFSRQLEPEFEQEYTLKIKIDGKLIEAVTRLPKPVPIKRVQFIPTPFERKGDSLNAIVLVDDPKGEDNFFRLKIHKIGQERPGLFYFVDDALGKDAEISMPVYFEDFYWGDTVIVEVMHTTREVSDYYSGLGENVRGSFNSIAPGNPVSNFSEEVMGVFAGYGIDRDTIIVSPFLPF